MQFNDAQSDSTDSEAQQWEDLRQRFRDANVPLSAEQEAQWQQANERLRAGLEPQFQANPICVLLRFFVLAILPSFVLDWIGSTLLGDAIVDYFITITEILTPEQRQVWEQSFSRNQNHSFWR